MEGGDVFLFQGVNTVQMCCAVMRSDFIHESTMDTGVLLLMQQQHSEKERKEERERAREREMHWRFAMLFHCICY